MNKVFLSIYLLSFIQINWAINICKKCDITESENIVNDYIIEGSRYYYGKEDNETCIIDPKRCNIVNKVSYFDTCRNCTIAKYEDHVFYGEEDNKECIIDLNYCNLAFGNKYHYSNKQYCEFCFFNSFKNKTYYGLEYGKECILNMVFCTQKMEQMLNLNYKECNWCTPFDVKFNDVNKTVSFISKQEDEKCYINILKCGFYNMKNYNGTDGSKNVCTYCHILEKKDGKYYGLENRMECRIQEKLCKNQIDKYEKIQKRDSNGSLRTMNININPLFTFILLIFITSILF